MAEFDVKSFERGWTDNYVNGPKNAGQRYENLLISRNRKPFSRPGSQVYDVDLYQIPTGTRIQHCKYHEGQLFEFSADEIYYRDSTFKELVGPVDSNDAFGNVGAAATSHNATASWKKHLYTTIDSFVRPRKIYKDENDAWQLRTVGLPSPGEVRGFATATALANSLKTVYNAHVADLAEHTVTDTAISSANATTIDTLIALANELKTRFVAHELDARNASTANHQAQTSDNDSLDSKDDVVTLVGAIALLNDLKAKYNAHDADATAHTTGSTHQESTADASIEFTIAPEMDDSTALIYAICYKRQYKIGSVTYIDRSAPTEVSTLVGPNFSDATHGLDISNIPELANDSLGTLEAWDTDTLTIEIYRSDDGGNELRKLVELPNGTTTYEDDSGFSSLGEVIYTNSGAYGNDSPPPCKYIVIVDNVAWYLNVKEGSEEKSFRARQSKTNGLDSSPGSFVVDIDGDITGGGSVGVYPIVFSENKTYRFEGIVDDLGRGFTRVRVVDDTVGCISHDSIVPVKDGLYFAALDGFYFTDGFNTTKITNHLNSSYKSAISTSEMKKRIYGTYDPINDRVFWALSSSSSADDNDIIWVHDPHWGIPNGEGTFTSYVYGVNGSPTALDVIDGNLLRSDRLGYTFIHGDTLTSDPVVNASVDADIWETKAVIYEYISCAFAFDSEYRRKWVVKLLTLIKSVGNVSILPRSINDDSGAKRDLKQIVSRNIFEWGDPFFTWGDPEFVWNAPSTATGMRRFPKRSLRCTFKQVVYTNAFAIVANSDSLGSVTVNAGAQTITLDSGEFPSNLVNGEIYIGTSLIGISISVATDTVLTVIDSSNQLVDGSEAIWLIKQFRQDEIFHLEGYVIIYEVFGASHTAFRVGDIGENA